MPSTIVTWRGDCDDRETEDRVLPYLRRLAERHEARRGGPPAELHPVSKYLHATRSEGLPDIPNVIHFDQTIEGNILVDASVFVGPEVNEWGMGMFNTFGRPLERVVGGGGDFIRLKRATLHGIQFRLYDPRGLYPGEDRMGFVFMSSDEAPFFDGCLTLVNDHAFCQVFDSPILKEADWYLAQPNVHLRYYLESWSDCFFTWLKHCWIPSLEYHHWEPNHNFETILAALAPLIEQRSIEGIDLVFDKLLTDFEAEADRWIRDMAGWQAEAEASAGGAGAG